MSKQDLSPIQRLVDERKRLVVEGEVIKKRISDIDEVLKQFKCSHFSFNGGGEPYCDEQSDNIDCHGAGHCLSFELKTNQSSGEMVPDR